PPKVQLYSPTLEPLGSVAAWNRSAGRATGCSLDCRAPRPQPSTPVAHTVDAYLDHLRVERRLADHSLEGYARDLRALPQYAAGEGRTLEALDRPALEAFVRQQMASGRSPRSVARSVAAVRGFYRFLLLEGRIQRSPMEDVRPPRAWPALPT